MDIFDVLLQAGLMTSALVLYLIFVRKRPPTRKNDVEPGWNYPLKWLFARYYAVKRWKASHPTSSTGDLPRSDLHYGWDSISVGATSPDGAVVFLGVRKLCGRQPMAEATLYVKMTDGTSYVLPRHPDTAIGAWEDSIEAWSVGGLKIQVLIPEVCMRILYNGILTRVHDGAKQHVQINYIWTSGTSVYRHPEDWSDQLAAHSLALEQWRDDDWPQILGKWEDGSWLQFGAMQGRFQSYDEQGNVDRSEYLRLRGVRERRWAPHGYQGLRRSVSICVVAKDGTAVRLRGLSYSNVLTEVISGCVRDPDGTMCSITSTDLCMPTFCETADEIPKVFTVQVQTKKREFRLVLSINADGGSLLSGIPYQQDVVYRSISGVINGEPASGLLELGYQAAQSSHPTVSLSPARALKWLSKEQAGPIGYCLKFSDRAAACTDYVGGKGASLALLASVQDTEGYKVPPGFCLTVRALEKHLESNPELLSAIKDIEAANENYEESNFKDKCNRASQLFIETALADDVRGDILTYLADLRKQATELGLEQRFAVRSSAVGEDSETLSAAGQNETILGCVSDDDVMQGVQKCWASMFAFTSAYYRRQNGQPCLCGGGVVVQTMVTPIAAGVMFSRHPDAGDPTRLLITANYGLGESVVSGTVEPDTIIVKRHHNGDLTIMKTELGSKAERVTTTADGVASQVVPESERNVLCLSEANVLELARIGIRQEELWGAGRDIEWAVTKEGIYLLQARPITSLERWSEEELLHEHDSAVMSDDDLITFANIGEVMPKPVSPLGYDLLIRTMSKCMFEFVEPGGGQYDCFVSTHSWMAMALYEFAYRRPPKEVNIGVRMQEMAIHGHKVADQHIIDIALHRRPYSRWASLSLVLRLLLWPLLSSKLQLKRAIKTVKSLPYSTENKSPLEIMDALANLQPYVYDVSLRHMYTSAASSSSQFIAMSVLLEGRGIDFSQEQCSEIGTMLSTGDVLSAEVPEALANLAHQIQESGRVEEFRAQEPKKALRWLQDNLPDVYKNVQKFLDEHGFRAVMEFDVATKPWVLVPEELMKVFASIRVTEEVKSTAKSDADMIAALKTPQKNSTRKVLSWVLPICRHMVRNREATKAQLILTVHRLRLMAIDLGKLLVREWYLPDPDLVFYFREHELRKFYKTRDPALLRKAIQRQQYFPKWSKLKFAELYTGWPEPLQVKGPSVKAGDVRVEATSVFGGEVIGRACVVKDFSEVHQLQQGDILITHSTDIGWSPYFPLLTGIATELGGLISHGAVIAREYGLPCIVGATGATDMFNTGDTVRLIGHQGILEKVRVVDDQSQQR